MCADATNPPPSLAAAIWNCEDAITRLSSLAKLLQALSSGRSDIDPAALNPIAEAVQGIVADADAAWSVLSPALRAASERVEEK